MPRESKRARRERTAEILYRLAQAYPDSRCSLDHEGPFQLLVATILSAQCTDALVNRVTPGLFALYPTAETMAEAPLEDLERAIGKLNYYRSKARALKGMSTALVERHGGEVPPSLDELVQLPGVGRKTANVVLGVGFGIADGIVVDTHVKRVANRLGLTTSDDPLQIEQDLLPLVPEEERVVFTHRFIDHGRAVCVARRPKCEECVLTDLCPSAFTAGERAGGGAVRKKRKVG
ncbi:MAG TPA: endonuclease III [Longimicrobiaceae bacterium]